MLWEDHVHHKNLFQLSYLWNYSSIYRDAILSRNKSHIQKLTIHTKQGILHKIQNIWHLKSKVNLSSLLLRSLLRVTTCTRIHLPLVLFWILIHKHCYKNLQIPQLYHGKRLVSILRLVTHNMAIPSPPTHRSRYSEVCSTQKHCHKQLSWKLIEHRLLCLFAQQSYL
jgi:hypothetical protein